MRKNYDVVEMEDGFYYETEDDWQGPFPTADQAQKALDAHTKWLSHDHENDIHKMRDHMGR